MGLRPVPQAGPCRHQLLSVWAAPQAPAGPSPTSVVPPRGLPCPLTTPAQHSSLLPMLSAHHQPTGSFPIRRGQKWFSDQSRAACIKVDLHLS